VPTARLLQKLGIFVVEDFLSSSHCNKLCKEIEGAKKSAAGTFSERTQAETLNHRIRKNQYGAVSEHTHTEVTSKIRSIKGDLETFFDTSLAHEFELPKYLKYSKGDFFAPHTDDQLNRKINISVNLNSQDAQDSDFVYEGGKLQFYGLITHGQFANRGISAPSNVGSLFAYPVDLVHEVTPVLSGARFSIVSRFLAQK